ncbi:MAG: PTS sugar transporter subunit IIA [Oscillospiraceae bacterium]|nr:PTS sugar transporter subunit IIA [Oscillospiraceae bacterium]
MKPKLILMSHGQLAEQLRQSAEMIVGDIEDVYTVCMSDSDGLKGISQKLQLVFDDIGIHEPVVIIADMMAGTPGNVAFGAMLNQDHVRVVTGLNLPMVIEYAVSDEDDLDQMSTFLCTVGIEAIRTLEKPPRTSGEEGYED